MSVHIPLGSAARDASGNSSNLHIPAGKAYGVYLNVTAVSGTSPTLDAKIQESVDGGTTWFDAGSFTQATGATKEKKTVPAGHATLVRINYTIGGTDTPTITFEARIITE